MPATGRFSPAGNIKISNLKFEIFRSYRGACLNRAVESHVHLASELPLLVPLDIGIRGMDFLLFLEF